MLKFSGSSYLIWDHGSSYAGAHLYGWTVGKLLPEDLYAPSKQLETESLQHFSAVKLKFTGGYGIKRGGIIPERQNPMLLKQ
jgi:hypothetical protein